MKKACSISKSINNQAIKILMDNNVSVDVWDKEQSPTKDELKKLLEFYDILIIGVKEKITKDMIVDIKNPKIIGTLSIGLDHIDKDCFQSDFINIVNCPLANVNSVAEHIFALILAASKRMQEANNLVIDGKGNKKFLSSKPNDISGKTIGLIGAGNISRKVIDIAKIFQMKILCYTFHPNNHIDLKDEGIEFVELDELLEKTDIINVSLPLTEQSRNLISKEKIDLLKENAIFINTSRSEITDVKALIDFADKNINFYLGLDIDVEEYSELLSKRRNNVIVTPHIGGCTDEAIQRTFIECSKNIVNVLDKTYERNSSKKR